MVVDVFRTVCALCVWRSCLAVELDRSKHCYVESEVECEACQCMHRTL